MKSALALVFLSIFASAFASHGIVHKHRCTSEHSTNTSTNASGGWGQHTSGTASFTQYSDCSQASCGKALNSAYSAAVNTFAFGAYRATGDACGRCFKITSNKDPYSPAYTGPFNSIVVRVDNLCPMESNQEWCGQTASNPLNQHGMSMHFDLCIDSGAAGAFFPSDRHAMTGTFEEVQCAGNWIGSDANEGKSLWNGSCLADENSPLWPTAACGNQGTPPQ